MLCDLAVGEEEEENDDNDEYEDEDEDDDRVYSRIFIFSISYCT